MQTLHSQVEFPPSDFVLHSDFDKTKGHTEFTLKEDKDGKGTGGGFVVYGDPNLLIQLTSFSFSGDGSLLAVGSTPSFVDIWDVQHRTRLKSFRGGSTVGLSSDGSLLATSGIAIWDTSTGKIIRHIEWEETTNQPGVQRTVKKLSFSPSGAFLSVTSNGSGVTIFGVQSGKKITTLLDAQDGQFSSDGSIYVGANYKTLTIWQVDGWKRLHVFPAGPDYITALAIAPDKKTAIIGGPHGAKIVDLGNGGVIARFGTGYVNSVSYLANGSEVMVGDQKGQGLWNIRGQEECADTELESGVALLSPGDKWFVVGAQHQRDVLLWKGESLLGTCHALSKK